MCDRKAVIKNADMSEEMQQDSVECATQALEKYNIEKDIAAHIKKHGMPSGATSATGIRTGEPRAAEVERVNLTAALPGWPQNNKLATDTGQ
uniref:Dynein light chain n=1 Tax=Equus caballus TaxID=9796 RepID=A0A9L0TAK7_HORSE